MLESVTLVTVTLRIERARGAALVVRTTETSATATIRTPGRASRCQDLAASRTMSRPYPTGGRSIASLTAAVNDARGPDRRTWRRGPVRSGQRQGATRRVGS